MGTATPVSSHTSATDRTVDALARFLCQTTEHTLLEACTLPPVAGLARDAHWLLGRHPLRRRLLHGQQFGIVEGNIRSLHSRNGDEVRVLHDMMRQLMQQQQLEEDGVAHEVGQAVADTETDELRGEQQASVHATQSAECRTSKPTHLLSFVCRSYVGGDADHRLSSVLALGGVPLQIGVEHAVRHQLDQSHLGLMGQQQERETRQVAQVGLPHRTQQQDRAHAQVSALQQIAASRSVLWAVLTYPIVVAGRFLNLACAQLIHVFAGRKEQHARQQHGMQAGFRVPVREEYFLPAAQSSRAVLANLRFSATLCDSLLLY